MCVCTSLHKDKKIPKPVMEIECKSNREELKETQKDRGGKMLRERPLDKGSTLSVARMTITLLCEERVKDNTVPSHKGAGTKPSTGNRQERRDDVRRRDINDRFLSRFVLLYA